MVDRAINDGSHFRSDSLSEDESENGEVALPETPCAIHPEYFFSPYEDERLEPAEDRSERILRAKKLCLEQCQYRFSCLKLSITGKETWGIWGGWQRTDRRDFKKYLEKNGFDGIPLNESELEWELHFFEGTDPNDSFDRPLTFKYGPSGLEDRSNSSLPEEDNDEACD